jgi:putative glycosyltransferase (TIGR04348 family)
MTRPRLVIVTPALRDANNGNWQTAQRWARLLGRDYRVRLAARWQAGDEDLMIALHARRSAASVAAWRQQRGNAPLLLVLTGTDLYRDIDHDAEAQRSLQLADRLVVLNELGLARLPPGLRDKARVCLQSCRARQPRPRPARRLRALMVGHLRDEKSPQTYFDAARLLAGRDDILLDHIGGALDPVLAAQARALMSKRPAARSMFTPLGGTATTPPRGLTPTHPHYRWLGALPHTDTRARIAAAHVLVHPSRMEGGAHVVIEAITSGTPVLASRIDGNLGLLGTGYPGVFEPGDAAGLAALLQQARDDPAMLPRLRQAIAERAPLFAPARESQTLLALVAELLDTHPTAPTPGATP